MRRAAWLVILLLGLVVAASMCGAGRVGYGGGYATGYRGVRGGAYQAGGVQAVWDTLLTVYSTRTAMGDTTGYGAAADTFNARWQAKKAAADRVLKWGVDDPDFAYCLVDTYHTGPASWVRAPSREIEIRPRATGSGDVLNTPAILRWAMDDTTASPRQLLVRIAPDLPPNSTIVSAKLHVYALNWTASAVTDSVVAVLMDSPADSTWWRQKKIFMQTGAASDTMTAPNMAKASYSYQWFASAAAADSFGYKNAASGNTATAPWKPALSTRNRWWKWGSAADWTPGSGSAYSGDFAIDITNCVQAIANGSVNNGIMITGTKVTTSDRIRRMYNFDQRNASLERCYVPWLEIKYITKRYASPFPDGKEVAFVFQTDDGIEAFNDSLVTIFGNNGGRFTAFLCDSMTTSGAGKATWMEAAERWHDSGIVEVGYHSWDHRPGPASEYLTVYEKSGIDAAKMTKLRAQMNPEVMYAAADSIGRSDLRASPNWGKSMALPGYPYSASVVKVAAEFDYNILRTGPVNSFTTTKGDYLRLPSWRPAACDTARAGFATSKARAPRNMMLLPLETEINRIVGDKANTTITEAQVKHNFRQLLRQIKAQNRGALALYEHDTKSGSYTYGVDYDEMRWMVQVAKEENAWICSASDYGRHLRAASNHVPTPDGYAQPDSFRFNAADRVWGVPHGVDNRKIRGVADRTIAATLDGDAPPPPSSVLVYGQPGSVVLTWSAASTSEPVSYNVYRYFDGADAVLVGTTNSTFFKDLTAINGSPHNYYIKTKDLAGNESAATATVTTTPGDIVGVGRPAYFAMWFKDPGSTISSGTLDSLATFDAIVTGPFPSEGAASEPGYNDFLSGLRARNDDIIVLQYAHPWITRTDGETAGPVGSPYKRMVAYANTGTAGADSLGYVCNTSGQIVRGSQYGLTRALNFMRSACADTVAKIWADAFENNSRIDDDFNGLFVDDLVLNPEMTVYDALASGATSPADEIFDADNDNTPFESDAQEKAALQTYYLDFLKALRREFAQRGMANRLIVANTTLGRAEDPSDNTDAIFALLDGAMTEGANLWFPGNAASDTTWSRAFAMRDLLIHSQVSPSMMLTTIRVDSSTTYMAEPLGLAYDTWIDANGGVSELYGNNTTPVLDRRLQNPGLWTGYDFQDGGADPDTLTSTWSAMTARLVLDRNAAAAATDTFAVWPYVVYDGPDTLSQSVFWESEGDIGAPASPTVDAWHVGDQTISAFFWTGEDENWSWRPRDFSHVEIARQYKNGPAFYDTFTVAVDTLARLSDNPLAGWSWPNTGLVNGREYKYKMRAVDMLGNASAWPAYTSVTPMDYESPVEVADLYAQGGDGYVDLDWTYPAFPADFEHFRIWRRITGSGLAFTLTDSVAISAHQDSTATSGTEYDYYVVAVDDDENASAASDTVVGSWYGDIEETYLPPTLVRALADNPTGRTSVVVYPPTDVTGLTGYSIYRGPYTGFASIDTAACVLYKQNIAPDIFNGAVFEDQHANTNPDSAFQYTARALYSGNASIKYPVPASALTTGGFSAQVPSCIAYGTGSDIAVAVVVLAGADSTRIFRGTSSGSQAYLTTVPIGTNPWTDSTATANTDYWYKVRQVDGALVSEFSAVAGPARWTSTPSGDPSISGVTNSSDVDHGETLTISGANFGTKATAAPQLYNDFDSYSEDQVATTAHGWSSVDAYGDGSGPWTLPVYSSDAGHVGKGLKGRFEGRTAISRVRVDRNWSGGVYLDYWYRHIEAEARSRNLKPWRFYGTGALELPQLNLFMQCADGSVQLPVSPSSAGPNYYMTSAENLVNQMRHWQFWLKPDVDGGTNGYMKVMLDGQVIEEHTGWGTNGPGLIGEYWAQLSISGYYSRSVEGGCPPAYITGNAYEYWDNLYIDNTQARVEIGNASTYATCTHREIQIPSAWAAGSITVTANTGSFADGSAYLFVIDSDGTASAGYPITVDAP